MPASRDSDDELRAIVALPQESLAHPAAAASAAYVRCNRPNADHRHADHERWPRRSPASAGMKTRSRSRSLDARRHGCRVTSSRRSQTSRAASVRPRPQADPPPGVTYRDILGGLKDPSALAHVLRRLQRPAPQPADADHAATTSRGLRHEWTFQTGTTTRGRGFEATPLLWDGVLYVYRLEQLRVGARRAHRPAVLDVSARPAGRSHLRRAGAGQSRLRHARPPAVHGHARRAPARVRSRDRHASSGTRCSPTTRSATRRRWRRS